MSKNVERNIPGMNRHNRFVEVEYAENVSGTLRRIVKYFICEKNWLSVCSLSLFLVRFVEYMHPVSKVRQST